MVDAITPALLDIIKDGGPAIRDVVFRSTERHRIAGGKSARLLRPGDRVALRDLGPGPAGDAPAFGSTVVRSVRVAAGDLVHVATADGRAHLVRGSRLVLVVREPAPQTGRSTAVQTGPISNGMLLGMTPQRRIAVIAELGPEVRRKLAHIAALGADREVETASRHIVSGHLARADSKLEHARDLSRLAAELTRDPAPAVLEEKS